jgi:hypothetical protein
MTKGLHGCVIHLSCCSPSLQYEPFPTKSPNDSCWQGATSFFPTLTCHETIHRSVLDATFLRLYSSERVIEALRVFDQQ